MPTETTTSVPPNTPTDVIPNLKDFAVIPAIDSDRDFSYEELFEISRRLEPHHAVFYQLWELGRPRFTSAIPTAAVAFDPDGDCIDFVINPTFWDGLTTLQKDFVVAHETLHVLLSHGVRAKDTEQRLAGNVAMDIVVNELLVSQFGFFRKDVDQNNKYIWRDKVFPKSNVEAEQTFEYYYNRLERMTVEQLSEAGETVDDHSNFAPGEGQGNGQPNPNAPRLPKDVADSLSKSMSEEEKKELARKLGKHQKPGGGKDGSGGNGEGGKEAGDFAGDLIKQMGDPTKVQKKSKWETVIKKWSLRFCRNDFKTLESWIRVNRRLVAIPDAALLPSEMEETELPEKTRLLVYLFLDTSGSCAHLADRFWVAGNSLPKKRFDVRMFCFDTQVYDVDPAKRKLYGFGGTSFDIIESRIQEILKKETTANKKISYPAAVFIITDGYGNHVKPQKPENWHWFLTADGSKGCIPAKSKTYNLKDYE